MRDINNYILEKLHLNRNVCKHFGNEVDNKDRIKSEFTKKDYLEHSKEDFIDPKNHLNVQFPDTMNFNWSLDSLFYCDFDEEINIEEIKKLLNSVSNKEINGKLLPIYSSRRSWTFKYLKGVKKLFKDNWDICYSNGITTRQENPEIFYCEPLLGMVYITNLNKYGAEKNYNSDGVKNLIEFVDNNFKYEDKVGDINMKIAFWNDRFSIFKFELEDSDKFILAFSKYFSRMNDTSNKNNKFYYDN
jgi:hypothetical protein